MSLDSTVTPPNQGEFEEETAQEQVLQEGKEDLGQNDHMLSLIKPVRARDLRWLRVGAELVGTFLICAVLYVMYSFGQLVLGQPSVILPALGTALTYLAVTAMLGRVSGGHFNPAVTVAAMFTSQISLIDGLLYIVAQILGALGAGALLVHILPTTNSIPAKTWLMFTVNGFDGGSPAAATLSQQHITFGASMAIFVELIGTVIVVGTALSTLRSDGRARRNHALYTGIAYGAGVLISYPITNAGLNPARSTGIAVFSQSKHLAVSPLSQLWLFWICPLLAASLVALTIIICSIITDNVQSRAMGSLADQSQTGDEGVVETESQVQTFVETPADAPAATDQYSDTFSGLNATSPSPSDAGGSDESESSEKPQPGSAF